MGGREQGTTSRTWPWLVAAVLLCASGTSAAVSTWLHWAPCRGSMREETWLDFRPGTSFSDACLRRMDGGTPFPYPPEVAEQAAWASELGAVAMLLAAMTWVPLLLTVPGLPWITQASGAASAVLTVAMAMICLRAAADPDRDPSVWGPVWLWLATEAAAVTAVVAALPVLSGRSLLSLALAAWGATAFGGAHLTVEFVLAVTFSEADWDVPPGTGYGTVLVLLVAGVGTAVLALGRRPADREVSLPTPQGATS